VNRFCSILFSQLLKLFPRTFSTSPSEPSRCQIGAKLRRTRRTATTSLTSRSPISSREDRRRSGEFAPDRDFGSEGWGSNPSGRAFFAVLGSRRSSLKGVRLAAGFAQEKGGAPEPLLPRSQGSGRCHPASRQPSTRPSTRADFSGSPRRPDCCEAR
jgi:hypothetical protein